LSYLGAVTKNILQ